MFQLLPVFLGLFDSTVQKLMNGFRDIFYELAYSNLSNMLSDLNEKVATISTELSTAPDAWQGGTIWELIVKIAEQVALPVAGTVFTFVVLWELISMLVQPNNLADIDFVGSVMYGFMYGCIFALVRVATGNLIYSVAMHGVFNMVNVAMAYIGITMVPGWIVLLAFSVGLAGFIILLIVFFKKNPVSLSKSSFKRRQLITREGYITLIICLCVTVMLLMM
ncbi:VirB6/TrbL-like conjugal transfer protein, CD1112 family [Coprococcus eutactus]|uniref:VirB6/TrbL-like conjugal transfer protein, CD1112 family n=1 Tax=Coprococcus eutactus TaxID=33043 RepID=UPI00321A3369